MTADPEDAEEIEVALEYEDRPLYEFVPDGDARLRCFIYECVASAEVHGRILVENCQMAFDWIKAGTVPPAEEPSGKRRAASLRACGPD